MSDRTQSDYARRTHERDEVAVMVASFDAQHDRYMQLLPSTVDQEVFRNAFLTAIQRRPQLLQADRSSLWLSLQQCATDGLLPDGREAALVIFNEEDEDGNARSAGKPRQVVYMPMIRGLRKLCRNTGLIAKINATLIYKGETVRIWREDGIEHFEHETCVDPNFDDSPGNIIGAYATVVYKDGTWEGEWMSRSKIERVRAVSKAKSSRAPWQTWYDEMARKTVLRRLLKQLDSSPQLRGLEKALENDPTLGPDTIDGEVQEIVDDIAPKAPAKPTPVTEIRPERRPRQPRSQPQESPTEVDLGPSPRQTREPPEVLQTRPEAPTYMPVTPEDTSEGFSGFLVGLDGVETTPEPFTSALQFASAFEALHAATMPSDRAALSEFNERALGDAYDADPVAAAIIDDIAKMADPVSPARQPVKIPRTAQGSDHWPNYAADCVADLRNECKTLADVDDWEQVNAPTYEGKAIHGKIITALRERRAALGVRQDAEDKDQRELVNLISPLAEYSTAYLLSHYVDGTVVSTKKKAWQSQGKDHLVKAFDEAAAARKAELGEVT